jgi:hypothetical protein
MSAVWYIVIVVSVITMAYTFMKIWGYLCKDAKEFEDIISDGVYSKIVNEVCARVRGEYSVMEIEVGYGETAYFVTASVAMRFETSYGGQMYGNHEEINTVTACSPMVLAWTYDDDHKIIYLDEKRIENEIINRLLT